LAEQVMHQKQELHQKQKKTGPEEGLRTRLQHTSEGPIQEAYLETDRPTPYLIQWLKPQS